MQFDHVGFIWSLVLGTHLLSVVWQCQFTAMMATSQEWNLEFLPLNANLARQLDLPYHNHARINLAKLQVICA